MKSVQPDKPFLDVYYKSSHRLALLKARAKVKTPDPPEGPYADELWSWSFGVVPTGYDYNDIWVLHWRLADLR